MAGPYHGRSRPRKSVTVNGEPLHVILYCFIFAVTETVLALGAQRRLAWSGLVRIGQDVRGAGRPAPLSVKSTISCNGLKL